MAVHEVVVTTELIDKNMKKGLDAQNAAWNRQKDVLAEMGLGMKRSERGLQAQYKEITRTTDGLASSTVETEKFQKVGENWVSINKKITKGFQRFRMELLGTMFFGMGMQKAFSGMAKGARELAGVTELTSMVLEDVFLPAAEDLYDIMGPLGDRFLDMSDDQKRLIGWTAMGGEAVGALLFNFGMLGLGINSVAMVVDKFGVNALKLKALSAITIGVGFYYLYEGLKDLDEGKITSAAGNALTGMAFFALAFGKNKAAGALAAIGIGLTIIDIMSDDTLDWTSKVGLALTETFQAAGILAIFGGHPYIGIGLVITSLAIKLGLIEKLKKVPETLAKLARGLEMPVFTLPGEGITTLQKGGHVKNAGVAYLHAGETVVPAGGGAGGTYNISNTFNITPTVSPDAAILAMELSDRWSESMIGVLSR